MHHIHHLNNKLDKFKKMINIISWQKAPLNIRITLWKVFAAAYLSYAGFIFNSNQYLCSKKSVLLYNKLYTDSLKATLGIKQTVLSTLYNAIGVLSPINMSALLL